MAFFPKSFYGSDSSFTPLFRLLDDFDSYSRQSGNGNSTSGRVGLSHWQPKFDVRETAENYELHGELPGVKKENVQIEFMDPQTMLVRGKIERSYTAGSPPAQIEDATMSGAITDGNEPKNAHQATVEDEDAADAKATPSSSTTVAKKSEDKKPADKAKYWLTERSVGEFSRSFNFPSRVDQDAVSASFKDGILSIEVPKAKKPETRRININ